MKTLHKLIIAHDGACFALAAVLAMLLTGCTVDLDVAVTQKGGAALTAGSVMGKAIEKTIRSVSGTSDTASLFNIPELEEQFSQAGFTGVSAQERTSAGLRLTMGITDIAEGIASVPGVITAAAKSGKKSVTITLTEQIMRSTAAMLPQHEQDYLELLMAPVLTGDPMEADEYLELMASVYGQNVADELAGSTLSITIREPAPGGRKTVVSVPLVQLLTLHDQAAVTAELMY